MDRWPETRSNHAGTQIFMRVVASILGAIVLFVLVPGRLPGRSENCQLVCTDRLIARSSIRSRCNSARMK
jgi:hypothetical protein